MKTRPHKSSQSHQRVAKHFREQLTEPRQSSAICTCVSPAYFLVAISVLQESHVFIHPYPCLFQNAALISLQIRSKIYISCYSCPVPSEEVCFSLIFFIASASPPQANPPLQQRATSYWDGTTVQWYGTTLWGGARRGRGAGGQTAVSSSLGKLAASATPLH